MFNSDLGNYLVLQGEGKEEQIKQARQQLRSHLLKYRDEMKKEAAKLDSQTAEMVDKFFTSIESLLDHMPQVDPAILSEHQRILTFLEQMLKKKTG